MTFYTRIGRPPSSNVLLASQHLWRACCQSHDEHRYDCEETPREKRGAGPFLPVKVAP